MALSKAEQTRLRTLSKDEASYHELRTMLEAERTKTAQVSLSFLDDFYPLILENSGELIGVHAPDGSFLYINPTFERTLGYTLDELNDMPPETLLHPDDLPFARNHVHQNVLSGNTVSQIEYRLRKKDSTYIWVEAFSTPIYDHEGNLLYLLAISRDISTRKSRADQQFKTLIENNPDLIHRLNQEGRFLYVNPALANVFGLPAQEIIGKTNKELGFPDHLVQEFQTVREQIYHTGEERELEFKFGMAGNERHYHVRLFPELDSQGNVETILAIGRDLTEVRQVQEALKESEERATSLLSAIPDLVFRMSRDGEYLDWHGSNPELMGVADQLIGTRISDHFASDVSDYIVQQFQKTLDTGEMQTFGYQLQLERGLREYEARTVVSGEDEVLAVVRDVTDARQAEKALRESEERANALLDAIPDLVFRLSRDGEYLDYQGNEEELIVAGESLIGTKVADHFDPDLSEQVLACIHNTLDTREIHSLEYRIDLPDGNYREHEARFLASGNDEVIAVVRNVTREREAERLIRRSEERYRSVLSAMVEGVVVRDEQGKAILFNDAANDLLGLSSEQLSKKLDTTPSGRFTKEDGEAFELDEYPAMVTLRTGQAQKNVLMGFTHSKSGDFRWVRVNTHPLKEPDNAQPYGVVVTFDDVTEERQAHENRLNAALARERTNLLSQFIQMASHEFRTPLSVILTNLHMLVQLRDEEKRKEKIERINTQVFQLNELIDMQLLMTKLDTGILFKPLLVPVEQVLEQALAPLETKFKLKRLQLAQDIEPPALGIRVDEAYFTLALKQILANAIRYSYVAGNIYINAYEDKQKTFIHVKDEGIGIAKEDMQHLFVRFWRKDKSHSEAGFGLGLSLSKKIIEQHHGTIEVSSDLNQGTTFTIVIPNQS